MFIEITPNVFVAVSHIQGIAPGDHGGTKVYVAGRIFTADEAADKLAADINRKFEK